MSTDIERFLDEEKRIKSWPAKKEMKLRILLYLSDKFEAEVKYSEKEINEIIMKWHTFGDFFLLRRGLIDLQLLKRAKDGSVYWKAEKDF